ncbi:MAG: Murein DD-endopeptidase MepM [Spirochaetes bacterium ADurb.Bin218]|jgi:murein DD-endopeptidase MepM/ murein hydrolase activator NlpD|nr:MAG: Murein DD-endopeptidase MepM [Spirochaetes bacterium ADurb.Bin218]
MRGLRFILAFVVGILLSPLNLYADSIKTLESLDYRVNLEVKEIREDVKKTIFTIKSRRNESELPELKFYRYKVKKGENFWVVLSRCSMDMDTLMSVNNLTSPFEVTAGTTLYIPNMRGVIVATEKKKDIIDMLATEGIDMKYIKHVNGDYFWNKKFVFVPNGKISAIERALFLGKAFLSPLKELRTTSGFGSRRDPFDSKRTEFHKGIDLGCAVGTKVHAARSGRIVFCGYMDGYGNLVVIEHEFGYQSYYGHLSTIKVKLGDYVKTGELIAFSGNTGRSTGPHLHFEIKKNGNSLNPAIFIKK